MQLPRTPTFPRLSLILRLLYVFQVFQVSGNLPVYSSLRKYEPSNQQHQPGKAAAEQSPSAAVDNLRRRCWRESLHTVEERMVTCLVETQLDVASAVDH